MAGKEGKFSNALGNPNDEQDNNEIFDSYNSINPEFNIEDAKNLNQEDNFVESVGNDINSMMNELGSKNGKNLKQNVAKANDLSNIQEKSYNKEVNDMSMITNDKSQQVAGLAVMQKDNNSNYSQLQNDLQTLEQKFEQFKASQLNNDVYMSKQQEVMNKNFEKIVLSATNRKQLQEEDIDQKVIEAGVDQRLYEYTRETQQLKSKVQELECVIRKKNQEVSHLVVSEKKMKGELIQAEHDAQYYKNLYENQARELQSLKDGNFYDAREADCRNREGNKRAVVENQRRYDEINTKDDYNFWKTKNDAEVAKQQLKENIIGGARGPRINTDVNNEYTNFYQNNGSARNDFQPVNVGVLQETPKDQWQNADEKLDFFQQTKPNVSKKNINKFAIKKK